MSATFDFSWRTYHAPYNIIEFINDTFYKLVEGLSDVLNISYVRVRDVPRVFKLKKLFCKDLWSEQRLTVQNTNIRSRRFIINTIHVFNTTPSLYES